MTHGKIEAAISNDVLNLRISGRIWQGEVASAFKYYIDNAISENVKNATLYINSEGGSVFEAQEAINELKRLDSVKITVGALAASAATMFLCYFDAECSTSSQFMIHKPSTYISGNEDKVKADLKALENLTNVYRSAYAKAFNLTEQEVEDLWKNDYWMDSNEAKEKGLVKTITTEEIEIDDSTIKMMVACGCPTIPAATPEKKNSTKNKMDINQLKAALGMPADATEEQVLARVAENKTKADNAAATEASANQQKEQAAEKVVNQAILDKKITADMKATYVSLHKQDPAGTEAILASMKVVTPASKEIKEKPDSEMPEALGRENWTIFDYLEKDPTALDALIEKDPAAVKKLNAVYASKN